MIDVVVNVARMKYMYSSACNNSMNPTQYDNTLVTEKEVHPRD
jgi:hypothetical protein